LPTEVGERFKIKITAVFILEKQTSIATLSFTIKEQKHYFYRLNPDLR